MTGDPTAAQTEILIRIDGGVGIITLNRPKAINSLNQAMVHTMADVLTAWKQDDTVHTVLLDGAGDRGLCAGGDIVAIYHSARGDGSASRKFFFDEYRLNALIGRFPKPYVALMDGIVMGGGVGVGAHGNVRVVTETTKMAMPEVGIGFIPDVGGTYLLSRAPGELGLHAALTGVPITGADAIALGFADYYVPHDELAAFTRAIVDHDVDAAVRTHAVETPASKLAAQRDWIDHCYGGETLLDIIAELRGYDSEPAEDAANVIGGRSPIALAVTLAAIRRARSLSTLEDALVQEFRVSSAALRSHDLVEGIRAQVIDKDRRPTWSPASIAAVTQTEIDVYFEPADNDLTF